MQHRSILITGGAGYVGGFCARYLSQLGHTVVILDNESRSHGNRLPPGIPYHKGQIDDTARVQTLLAQYHIEVVLHCAAYAYVEESVRDPFLYYRNNLSQSTVFLEAAWQAGVRQYVFSSSCATYGVPASLPITEQTPQCPISPYGQTKYFVEGILQSVCKHLGGRAIALRYFNAAGAATDGSYGERHNPETHLIPNCLRTALGLNPAVAIYGDQHPTPDGTCLRDFVHVEDLARAHALAIERLGTLHDGSFEAYNLSIGKPYSVREVIQVAQAVSGLCLPTVVLPPRAGDPPALYAQGQKARAVLGWEPQYTDLQGMVRTAWHWHRQELPVLPKGPGHQAAQG